MENVSNVSSEEELLQLRNEGKISEAEYEDLLGAMKKSSQSETDSKNITQPEFRAFRKRILTGVMIICVIGLPVGLALEIPYVWGLSIAGIIVGGIKLSRISDSWLARIVNKRNQHGQG